MDPHLLRTFVAVVEHRSFSAAAQALGYTQSAVSQHIAALENDLGTRLVERRPVGPTAAGERLMEHASPLLLRIDAARADVARVGRTHTAALTLACSPAALTPRVAGDLARLRTDTAGLAVDVEVLGRAAVAQAVLTGAADLGLIDGAAAPSDPLPMPDTGPVTGLAVAEGPLAVLLPTDHPLAHRRTLRLFDLADAHWIDAPDTAVPLAQLRAAANTDGFRPHLTYHGTDVHGLGTLVAAGHGLAALPLSLAPALPGTAGIRLSAPRLVHRTEVLHPRAPSAVAQALVAALTG
ncbi:LysR family transcriptional regulator [Streptomyces sp. NBC_00053]|uniref:LysR family transcriptional regulator n=1 Tax=unclassified Streptomyces TaxID=2593676 RepID=UPI00224DC0F3|nr:MULTISPECIES: LysR family transcriptional regulator [unclassified Streptomyces]MCX5504975.1 LysR family transcriptional regulator [Streptomyces sp. NBC_00052]MCX5546488.1 LysR family transcriptional regulator [Streptomyces sp. NBC_00051]